MIRANKPTRFALPHILLGVLISSNLIVDSISTFLKIQGLFPIFCFVVATILFVAGFRHLRITKTTICLLSLMGLYSLVGFLTIKNESSTQFLLCFLSIGLLSTLSGSQRIDIEIVCKTLVVVGIITSFHAISIILNGFFAYRSGEQMGISYSFLPIVLSSIFVLFHKTGKTFKALSIIAIVLSLGVILRQMTRGVLLCIIVFLVLFLFLWATKSSKRIIVVLFLLMLLFLIYFAFIRSSLLNSKWFYQVFKTKSDDILNGRSEEYLSVLKWRGFLNFAFGSGVGSYQTITGKQTVQYIHNLFLFVFYEQGIITLLPITLIFLFAFKALFSKKSSYSEKCVIIFLLSISFVRLMISYYFWIDPVFWISIGYFVALSKKTFDMNVCARRSLLSVC